MRLNGQKIGKYILKNIFQKKVKHSTYEIIEDTSSIYIIFRNKKETILLKLQYQKEEESISALFKQSEQVLLKLENKNLLPSIAVYLLTLYPLSKEEQKDYERLEEYIQNKVSSYLLFHSKNIYDIMKQEMYKDKIKDKVKKIFF